MEPFDWVLQDLVWLQVLLCGDVGQEAQGDGFSTL